MSRKGRTAAPAASALMRKSRGCFAALSRHKAAPTEEGQLCPCICCEHPAVALNYSDGRPVRDDKGL
ncbi:hypothetical protein DMX06_22705 [Pseudomonas mosselii]|nr:hypothetical protein DMX06_22705 [Pseudomonas mosselii]